MIKRLLRFAIAILIISIAILACKRYEFEFRSSYREVNFLIHETQNIQSKPFLKAHLKNGEVIIFGDAWQIDTINNIVTGIGTRYSPIRKEMDKGDLKVAIDSVALFETNKKLNQPEYGRIIGLTLLAGLDIILGVYCISNPKACFGSCPTFYIDENDSFHYSDAEGFSNAILPSMEYADIDALGHQMVPDHHFSITMKNEALETHCVNSVKLLAFPTNTGECIFQSPSDEFYRCENQYPVVEAHGEEGDITALLRDEDRRERFSLADAQNLSSREEVYLNFAPGKSQQEKGLVLHFRQTLMTTFLIYSAIGYMGDEAGDILANLETNHQQKSKLGKIKAELGDLEVYSWNSRKNRWDLQGGFYETGPIAINRQFLPLKDLQSDSTIRLKLVLNKGLWRIDYTALTDVKARVVPLEISPERIENNNRPDAAALKAIIDPANYLISMPGSSYRFHFPLPEGHSGYELFLKSQGYYLEWMREHWIRDKNLWKLKQMVDNPKTYLRAEAPFYKKYEAVMEQEFWNSKINPSIFSYYEN